MGEGITLGELLKLPSLPRPRLKNGHDTYTARPERLFSDLTQNTDRVQNGA